MRVELGAESAPRRRVRTHGRYYVGHRGKFGHEFLEFEFRPDGKARACCVRPRRARASRPREGADAPPARAPRMHAQLRYSNNSNYKNDTLIRKEAFVSQSVLVEVKRIVEASEARGPPAERPINPRGQPPAASARAPPARLRHRFRAWTARRRLHTNPPSPARPGGPHPWLPTPTPRAGATAAATASPLRRRRRRLAAAVAAVNSRPSNLARAGGRRF